MQHELHSMAIDYKGLKVAELRVFQEFDRVCKQLGVRYFACYGTALGAVRHRGFIPWDDDIDVGMLRPDYEKFRKEAPSLLASYLFLQNYDTDKDYWLSHAKLRDSRTTYIEEAWKDYDCHHGVFIDIFPFDYIPDGRFQRKLMQSKVRYYQNIIALCSEKQYGKLPGWKNKIRALLQPIAKWMYRSRPAVVKRMEAVLSATEPSSLVYTCEDRFVYKAEWFSEVVEFPFEDAQMMLPIGWHEILSIEYGDYMTPPPPEHRHPIHSALVVDLDKPYTFYRNGK